MGLLYADSCAHYRLLNDITRKWTFNNISSCRVSTFPDGSNTQALTVFDGIGKTLSYENDITVGFRIYLNSAQGTNVTPIYTWSSANNITFAIVSIEADYTISLFSGNSTTRIYNSGIDAIFLQPFVAYYIEVHLVSSGGTCPPSSSSIEVAVQLYLNTVLIGSGSGPVGFTPCDTINQSNKANFHLFSGNNLINGAVFMKDFYVATGLSAPYGDLGMGAIFPDSDATNTGWTAIGGSGGIFGATNPQFPDINDDTIYAEATLIHSAYECLFQPVDPTLNVPFVHYGVYHKKDSEGFKMFQLTMAGVPVSGIISSGDDYSYSFVPLDTGPGGAAWTPDLLNSTSFGIVLID